MYSVVGQDGQVYGPVDLRTLEMWIGQGRVVPTTVLISVVSGNHGQASTWPDVAPYFRSAVPPQHLYQQGMGQGPYAGAPMPGQPYGAQGNGNVNVVVNSQAPGPGYYGPNTGYRSKLTAGLLALFLGGIGIHQFYLGKNNLGITMLVIFIVGYPFCLIGPAITGIWAVVDAIMIFTGSTRDNEGRPLV